MSVPVPLFLVEKAAALELEEALPALVARRLDARGASAFCLRYRRAGIARLLGTGLPDELFTWLAMAGQAFAHWLAGVPEDRKLGSFSGPFLDAVAAGADQVAGDIARSAAAAFRPGEEYEEGFLYLRFLMTLGALDGPAAKTGALVERLEALAGEDDPHAALCRALQDRDQDGLDAALDALVQEWDEDLSRRREGGRSSPDEEATTAVVSVELLALLRIAGGRGLVVEPDHRLAPSVARRLDRARLPGPDEWRQLPSYRVLG